MLANWFKAYIASLVRHFLTGIGIVGLFTDSGINDIAAVIALFLGLAWSAVEKKLNLPAPPPLEKPAE